jgi:16S rRNA (adenine1518-N6/adenine1519-N6)-dimethyltransferase
LTEKILSKNPSLLRLIELDLDMIDILNDRIKNWDLNKQNVDFKIINIDVLKYFPEFKNYFVIANIPYYITSPILKHFLYDVENKPEKMLILMQKDVGDKIIQWQLQESQITKKNKNKTSVLSLFIAKKAKVKEVLFVWKQNFIPVPKVESSVLLFELHNLYNNLDDKIFLDFIKKWFSEPRKKLIKNLVKQWLWKDKLLEIYNKMNLDENIRAEDLTLSLWLEFIKLYIKD